MSVSLLISGSIALPDAARSAAISISYHQVGICKGYDTAAGPVTTRSDEAFAIFKIEAVDNTKPSGPDAIAVEGSALSPARHRINSSCHLGRPTPGTGNGVAGSTVTRQRVTDAVGCPKSVALVGRRQRRMAMPMVLELSAAS